MKTGKQEPKSQKFDPKAHEARVNKIWDDAHAQAYDEWEARKKKHEAQEEQSDITAYKAKQTDLRLALVGFISLIYLLRSI